MRALGAHEDGNDDDDDDDDVDDYNGVDEVVDLVG